MIVAVTGTRQDLTPAQLITATHLFQGAAEHVTGFHNGGCIGADRRLFSLACAFLECPIDVWPALVNASQRFNPPDWPWITVHELMPPLERNEVMVTLSDVLWAFPGEDTEQLRSGTWATVRRARKISRSLVIVLPNGEVTSA